MSVLGFLKLLYILTAFKQIKLNRMSLIGCQSFDTTLSILKNIVCKTHFFWLSELN